METIGRRYNICFLGVTSFNPSGGFCCESEEDCLLKQAAIRQSDIVVALMDSKKFDQYNTHSICRAEDVQYVISDDALTNEQRSFFERHGVTVL